MSLPRRASNSSSAARPRCGPTSISTAGPTCSRRYYSHILPYDTHFFLYANDGTGHLVDVSDSARVSATHRFVEGADVTDWDGDGDLDLYFTSRLHLNDGSGRFTDVSAEVGLPDIFDEGWAFVDVDNDGDFDLYIRNGDTPRLYRNDNGRLAEVTAKAGFQPTGCYWGDAWADVDNDGDQDVVIHIRAVTHGCCSIAATARSTTIRPSRPTTTGAA
jgi:hypothetical protein